MYRLIKFLAVIALALSPVWGVQTVDAVNHDAYPVWPSFLSTGCQAIQGPGGSTTVVCGQGAFLLTQINSGYACNEVDINITSYGGNPFLITGTVNSGSQENSVSVQDTGDYYMRFPGYLTNNLVTLQIQAPDGGSLTIGYIASHPCPVVPTETPVPDTATPNPSSTATPVPDTATPGPSQTPTAIPTYTPLPSGHNTFTPSVTPTGTIIPPSPSVTSTPGPSAYNCGSPSFPLLNCGMIPATGLGGNTATNWTFVGPNANPTYKACSQNTGNGSEAFSNNVSGYGHTECYQSVTAQLTGTLYARYNYDSIINAPTGTLGLNGTALATIGDTSCAYGSGNYCIASLGTVASGTTYNFDLSDTAGGDYNYIYIVYFDNLWVQPPTTGTPTISTPTVGPTGTATPSPTTEPGTATAAAKLTLTAVAADYTATPIPIPGAQSTPIATSTECPGGCAVAALTAIPGLATRVLVDTSPFSELTHLSLARNSCKAFGYVQIPEPVIHGTPALGSTTPLSITWTLPVTHDWDNTNPYSNTAIQPCAMNEIPTFVWDLTYWFSVFAIFTVWIMWLLGFVGRFSGDENING